MSIEENKKSKNRLTLELIIIFLVSLSGFYTSYSSLSMKIYYNVLPINNFIRNVIFTENTYAQLISSAITIVFIRCIFRYNIFSFFKKKRSISMKIAMLVSILITIISVSIELVHINNARQSLAYIIEIIKLFIVVGLFEELVYRGFIANQCQKIFSNKLLAACISGFLFAAFHLPAFFAWNDSFTAIDLFFRLYFPLYIGIVYSMLFFYTEDLLLLIILHGTTDVVGACLHGKNQIVFLIIYHVLFLIFWISILYRTLKVGRNKKRC